MKKILVFLILFISFVEVTKAEEVKLVSEKIPYYVMATTKEGDEYLIQGTRILDTNRYFLVYNLDFKKDVDTSIFYEKYTEVNEDNFGEFYKLTEKFANIEYYGYTFISYYSGTSLDYFITQVILWENLYDDVSFKFVDSSGNVIHDYDTKYEQFNKRINDENLNSNFLNKTYDMEIWSNMTFTYNKNEIILDNPIMDELSFENWGQDLKITANEIGSFEVDLHKDSSNCVVSYKGNGSYYWQNIGTTGELNGKIYINVDGIPFRINETVNTVNGYHGDAVINDYELYLDNKYKIDVSGNKDYFVKSNSDYTIKDKSIGLNKLNDISFRIDDNSYVINIYREVISKSIDFNVLDDSEYKLYLKSNNELYYIINKNTENLELPYGVYYLTNRDYYKEIEVIDEEPLEFVLDSSIKNDIYEDIIDNVQVNENIIDNEIIIDKEEPKKEILTNKKENDYDVVEEKEVALNNIDEDFDIIDLKNPKTYDYVIDYLIVNIISLSIIIMFIFRRKKYNN